MRSERFITVYGLVVTLIVFSMLASSCLSQPPIPTAASIDQAMTAQFITENAPPSGFAEGVAFPQIDANLDKITNWHYIVTLNIDGTYFGTEDKAVGEINAEIFSNELAGERRVILKVNGDPFGLSKERTVEGVRIGNTFYLVDQNKACNKALDPASQKVATLTATGLVGGIKKAAHTYQHKTISNLVAWQYTFLPEDVTPPPLQLGDNGNMTIASGDLWIAPSRNVVVDYTITYQVENAVVQGSKPISGQVRATYKLAETGVPYNISIPYGC